MTVTIRPMMGEATVEVLQRIAAAVTGDTRGLHYTGPRALWRCVESGLRRATEAPAGTPGRETLLQAILTVYGSELGMAAHVRNSPRDTYRMRIAEKLRAQPEWPDAAEMFRLTHSVLDDATMSVLEKELGRLPPPPQRCR